MSLAAEERQSQVLEQVDSLTEEVKVLALNLAIYLAKAKPNSKQISNLEPEFVRLVNGTVKVVQEIARIISAARHITPLVYDVPSGRMPSDHIEVRLRSLSQQCRNIIDTLNKAAGQGTDQLA